MVKCRPHHPEGKARLERAFGIIEQSFLSALPGYNGGNPLKPRLKGRGKPVAPYDREPERLLEDLHLAIAQYNGTAQDGDLKGQSPKGMLEAKIERTGWRAQKIHDTDMFDLVFSREERRDVRQSMITIGHRLTPDTFALNDKAGARRKAEMIVRQRHELARREAKADATIDVQQMLSDAADLGPVHHNAPDGWTFTGLDKGGFLGAPISEEEARARQDTKERADMEEFLAACGGVKGERTAAATAGLSHAAYPACRR